MFRSTRSHDWPGGIDLSTVRDTIAYIESDVRRSPGLERVAEALSSALAEIDKAERASPRQLSYAPLSARFLPRR